MREKVTIGNAELWLGDCREILPSLPKVDLILTDPPYGIGINKSHRLATSRGHVGEVWDNEPIPNWLILLLQEQGRNQIIWGGNYYNMGPGRGFLVWDKQNDGRDFADCEMAWTSLDAVARIFRKRPMNMDGGKVHPTQKPRELMEWCIGQDVEAKTICDPFMGSGTTGVACANLGKRFIGIEREPKYFEIACKRIEHAVEQQKQRLFEPEPEPTPKQEPQSLGLDDAV